MKTQPNLFEDIRSWSREIAEQYSPHHGMAACPYAAQAWKDNQVQVSSADRLITAIRAAKTEITIWPSFKVGKYEHQARRVERLNARLAHRDLHLILFHPDAPVASDDAFAAQNNWQSSIEDEYLLIFIQRLGGLNRASEQLERAGYYDNASPEFKAAVQDRRNLEHGYGTSPDGQKEAGKA
jgi:hypothetical protein